MIYFLPVSPPRPYTPPLLTNTRHMPSPSHSSRFYRPHNIGCRIIDIIYQIPYNATYSYYTPYYSLQTWIVCAATFYQPLSLPLQHIAILYFINSVIHNFSWHNCKLPEDGVFNSETCRTNFNINFTLLISAYVGIIININQSVCTAEACYTDTTPTQPHRNSQHIETRKHDQCGDTIEMS